jgi:hypothetical protein
VASTTSKRYLRFPVGAILNVIVLLIVAGCSTFPDAPTTPPSAALSAHDDSGYIIGPTDQLNIVVWHQPELSSPAIVRPDGKISIPLINDMPAAGRTPTALEEAITAALKDYIQSPKVTVIVTNFIGPYDRQIRVVGEAARPQAIPGSTIFSATEIRRRMRTLCQGTSSSFRRRIFERTELHRA